ncbi:MULTISPECIES: STY4534 family ICE replication protein [unclassified Serratia (in: enterobacteria)]|uniref:STY4534 family ICE replication protein n=1 Tax=unclassified Serratia (in: enterobacteria) TaxID=2647522 RepID=UPI0030767900
MTTAYFNLNTTGLGYLNDIRTVTPKKGDPFQACRIAALNGPTDNPEYCYFDVRVYGSEAQHLINRCQDAVTNKHKVLIGFRLGDLWSDIFTYTRGKREGQQAVSLKARLLFIHWIKIDGKLVYRAEPKTSPENASPVANEHVTVHEAFPAEATA